MEFTGERVIPNKVPEDLYNEHISRYRFASRFIKSGYSIIDVGCGTGYGTYELSTKAKKIVGVDISPEAIDYANENYYNHNLSYICHDSKQMNLEEKFELAVSFEVIEHIDSVEMYLESIKKCLSPEGIFIVSTPNKKMYSDAIENYNNSYHVKEYYLDEFKGLLNGYFKHIIIYSQDFLQGLIFRRNDQGTYTTNLDYSKDHKYDPDSASFFVAVCSDVEIDNYDKSLLYTASENNILAEKDRYISALKHEIDIRDNSVVDLKKSIIEYEKWTNLLKKNIEEYQNWIEQLKIENNNRDKIINHYKQENEELLKWIELANGETLKRDESVVYLQNENKVLKEQLNILQMGAKK